MNILHCITVGQHSFITYTERTEWRFLCSCCSFNCDRLLLPSVYETVWFSLIRGQALVLASLMICVAFDVVADVACCVCVAVVSTEQLPDKKALKIIKVQERGISVLTTTDRSVLSCSKSWSRQNQEWVDNYSSGCPLSNAQSRLSPKTSLLRPKVRSLISIEQPWLMNIFNTWLCLCQLFFDFWVHIFS